MQRVRLIAILVLAVPFLAAAQRTYVWPDCDTSHPCVVHHIDSVADGTAYGETLQDFKFPMEPSSPGNLLIFTVMHVSSKAITVTDNNGGAWQTAVSTTNTADGQESEILYICGATAGTNLITIHMSQPAVHDEPLHFTYDEVSGIAPSACLDGTAAANGLKGTVQPGPVTTTADGDLIFNYGEETYQYPEADNPITNVTPDASSALLMENIVDKYANEVSLQSTHGSFTPTLTVHGDTNARNWNSVAAAFKASSGAGTQPTGIHVTRILHFVGELTNPVTVPFPSSGNAIVISTSNPSVGGWDMANLADNEGHTWTRTPFTNPPLDPQIFSTCLGTGTGGQNLVISWNPSSINNHVLFYDIAGAATAGGSTGCVGATVNTYIGYQPNTTNAPITGDPVLTPTTAGSVIVATSYFGIGPPSASLTPGVVFNSIWATGMIDSSSWDTGDPYSYAYTTSTSPISFNYQMANSTLLANGGTNFDGAAIEILPSGSATGTTLSSIAVTPASPSIAAGTTQSFTATGTYSDSSTKNITTQAGWTSSSPATATISAAGVATAACPGTSTIAAALSGITGQTTLTVTGLGTTATALTSSANPAAAGQTVTFTAAVTSACGTPTGTVQFAIDGASYGAPVTISAGGIATTTATLATGSHTVAAAYSGSSALAASVSSTLTETVGSGSTSSPVITDMSPLLTLKGSGAFTLTISGSGFTSGSTVYWGTSALATQFVSATQLTAQVPATDVASAGISNITVQTAAPGSLTSNIFQFEVDSAGASIAPPSFNPATAAVAAGSTGSYTVTLPANAMGVSTQCLNLPAGATCSYSASSGVVTVATASSTMAGAYRITVVFTETLPVTASAFSRLPILLLPLAGATRRRSMRTIWVTSGLVLLLLVGAGCTAGCGTHVGSTSTTSNPQTQTVTSSAVVTLTVQ
ncbi:MAG: Ig-like domain repeat protein [Acidobacteriota bacterium]